MDINDDDVVVGVAPPILPNLNRIGSGNGIAGEDDDDEDDEEFVEVEEEEIEQEPTHIGMKRKHSSP